MTQFPGNRVPAASGEVDLARAAAAVRELLIAVGEDPDRPGLKDTPARVARAYAETFAGLGQDPTEVLATVFDEDHDELVLVKDIPMYSTCEHHLVPFHGVAHVGYIPGEDGKVTGLSKLARLVEVFARRPLLVHAGSRAQQRLGRQFAHLCTGAPTSPTGEASPARWPLAEVEPLADPLAAARSAGVSTGGWSDGVRLPKPL